MQPIKDEEDKVEYILTLGYDVTNEIEYKNKLEEIQEQIIELEEKEFLKKYDIIKEMINWVRTDVIGAVVQLRTRTPNTAGVVRKS